MPKLGEYRNYTIEQAAAWRAEYDADATLRVADLAGCHRVDSAVMRAALVTAGGALRPASVVRVARRRAGLG